MWHIRPLAPYSLWLLHTNPSTYVLTILVGEQFSKELLTFRMLHMLFLPDFLPTAGILSYLLRLRWTI